MKYFNFLLFYNPLDLNNQKILWLPSIYEFERTGTNLNHPIDHLLQIFALWVNRNTHYFKKFSFRHLRRDKGNFLFQAACFFSKNQSKKVVHFFLLIMRDHHHIDKGQILQGNGRRHNPLGAGKTNRGCTAG